MQNVVVGLGVTGVSLANFLQAHREPFMIMDEQPCDTLTPSLKAQCLCGPFDQAILNKAKRIFLSPGVAPQRPAFVEAQAHGALLTNDMNLFALHCKGKIVAITGSNGKSSVTTMVARMLNDCGYNAVACGNIGLPVLDTLQHGYDYYVVEVSSFQLELIDCFQDHIAVLLNFSADHLDRHQTEAAYLQAKQRVYNRCQTAVINVDEAHSLQQKNAIGFSMKTPLDHGFYFDKQKQTLNYAKQVLLRRADLTLNHCMQVQNTLAALAIAQALYLDLKQAATSLKQFTGLAHRCQLISRYAKRYWINDSKATNVGAALAAVNSMSPYLQHGAKLIVLAGGQAKGVDFGVLRSIFKQTVSELILLGEDAAQFAKAMHGALPCQLVSSMQAAVNAAFSKSAPNDVILLAPACASFDMFDSYAHRGQCFIEAVENLGKTCN